MNLQFNENSFQGWIGQYKSHEVEAIVNYFNDLGYIKECELYYREIQYFHEYETDIIRRVDIQIEESAYVMIKLLDEIQSLKTELNRIIGEHELLINGEEI